jgi:arginine/lysine/ornithine decarboxylase
MTAAPLTTIQQPKIVQSSAASTSSANAAKNFVKNFNSKLDALTKSTHQTTSSSPQMSLLHNNNSSSSNKLVKPRHFCGRLLSTNLSSQTKDCSISIE